MAICNTCKQEGKRVRSRWNDKGEQLPDECPRCSPDSFEKFTAPSDKKIWMGYEVHPNEYIRAADGGFDRKPEYRAEQENKLKSETDEERSTRLAAEQKKRRERRKRQMDDAEFMAALKKARMVADYLESSEEQGVDVN